MPDETIVQPTPAQPQADAVVQAPAAEVAPSVASEPPKPPETLTKAEVEKMIAEATAKAVEQAKEIGRRELQSQQDRNRAEIERANRRAQIAEQSVNTLRTRVKETDPELEKDLRLAEYETRDRMTQQELMQERQRQEYENAQNAFVQTLADHVNELGIDPKDSRLNWGSGGNFFARQQAFLKSVATIQKQNMQALNEKIAKQPKEIENKIRQELGLDSVDTSIPSVVTTDGIPTNKKAFGDWYMKQTEARLKELKPKIDEMINKGLIK